MRRDIQVGGFRLEMQPFAAEGYLVSPHSDGRSVDTGLMPSLDERGCNILDPAGVLIGLDAYDSQE